jgi:hypothetical protein
MKKTKSLIALMTFVLFFACVLSCDEQDLKLETKVPSKNVDDKDPGGRNNAPLYDGSEGDPLDIVTARSWVANFKGVSAKSESEEIRAHYFGREIIETLLNESDCAGIRIYYALDENGQKKLLIVGVDSTGEDLLPAEGGKTEDDDENIIADFSFPCPNTCPNNGL